jgi:hypothetical protein
MGLPRKMHTLNQFDGIEEETKDEISFRPANSKFQDQGKELPRLLRKMMTTKLIHQVEMQSFLNFQSREWQPFQVNKLNRSKSTFYKKV